MLSKEEIKKAFKGMEYFIDDDMGGYYKSVVGNQEANSMLGYLKIRDYILSLQNKVDQLETNNKKLIKKLKEVIDDDEMSDIEYQMKRELAIEILKIAKGEK